MARKRLSQRDLAGILGGWSQSRIAKLLTGRVQMTLPDLESLCFAVGISVTEAVRDRGMEFCAEMTPRELRRFETLRRFPESYRNTIDDFIKMVAAGVPGATVELESRGAHRPHKKILGTPRR